MSFGNRSRLWVILAIFLLAWLGLRYVLPLLLPFLLGLLIALAAEPAVRFATSRMKLSRPLAAGLAVTLTLLGALSVMTLIGALAVKELANLAGALPDVQQTVEQGLFLLQDWLVGLAGRMPDGVRSVMTGAVLELFGGGSALLRQLLGRIPGMVRSVLNWLPGGALGVGTGILAGYMISARLPGLRRAVSSRLPESWQEKVVPALRRVRRAVGGWLKAQGVLLLVTYGIVAAGLMLLKIPYGMFWALPVAVVDAIPVLGTGTVLLPWGLVALLQGDAGLAAGLLGIYGMCLLCRTLLEPRLVGHHLGLDPLVTLVFLYVGFRLWGILGMILAPMLAAAAKGLTDAVSQ